MSRVRMLVGVCRSDLLEERGTPIVAGALDEVVWEHCDVETLSGLWDEMKERLDPGGDYYEWREISVSMDEDAIRGCFDTPSVTGEIEGAS